MNTSSGQHLSFSSLSHFGNRNFIPTALGCIILSPIISYSLKSDPKAFCNVGKMKESARSVDRSYPTWSICSAHKAEAEPPELMMSVGDCDVDVEWAGWKAMVLGSNANADRSVISDSSR